MAEKRRVPLKGIPTFILFIKLKRRGIVI